MPANHCDSQCLTAFLRLGERLGEGLSVGSLPNVLFPLTLLAAGNEKINVWT